MAAPLAKSLELRKPLYFERRTSTVDVTNNTPPTTLLANQNPIPKFTTQACVSGQQFRLTFDV